MRIKVQQILTIVNDSKSLSPSSSFGNLQRDGMQAFLPRYRKTRQPSINNAATGRSATSLLKATFSNLPRSKAKFVNCRWERRAFTSPHYRNARTLTRSRLRVGCKKWRIRGVIARSLVLFHSSISSLRYLQSVITILNKVFCHQIDWRESVRKKRMWEGVSTLPISMRKWRHAAG